jgi:mRNA interferase RelE/StbE
MAVKFHKQAIKFLQKANPEDVANIQAQLRQLFIAVEEQSVIPFTVLDIKKLNFIYLLYRQKKRNSD